MHFAALAAHPLKSAFDIVATSPVRLCPATWCGVLQYVGDLISIAAVHNLSDLAGDARCDNPFREALAQPMRPTRPFDPGDLLKS